MSETAKSKQKKPPVMKVSEDEGPDKGTLEDKLKPNKQVAKPCPFCGNEPTVYRSSNRIIQEIPSIQISCISHECVIKPSTQALIDGDLVFDTWNDRRGE